jgi:hypothetical protein
MCPAANSGPTYVLRILKIAGASRGQDFQLSLAICGIGHAGTDNVHHQSTA